jgi:hypothetical protein
MKPNSHISAAKALVLLVAGLMLVGSASAQTAPSITTLSPNAVLAGSAGFTLNISGFDFGSDFIVKWNGSDRPTNYVNSNKLTASITATDIASAGTASITVTSGGNSSNTATLTITGSAVPRITSLHPSSVVAGSNSFTLTVLGEGFTNHSKIQWNGIDLVTNPFSLPVDIEATIPASMISFPGLMDIRVLTDSYISNTVQFSVTVNSPAPEITGLDPISMPAKSPSFTLEVEGNHFSSTCSVFWNAAARATTYISNHQLEATITADDILQPGTAAVTVRESSPGGSTSNAISFTISPYSSIYFPQVAVGGGYTTVFTLTNNGSGAVQGNLHVTGQDGAPFLVSLTDNASGASLGSGSSFSITVPSGATKVLSATAASSGAPTKSGWARVDTAAGILNGVATFLSRDNAGVLKGIAGVMPAALLTTVTIPVDNDDSAGRYTGFSIANPSDHIINITIVTLDKDGNLLDTLTPSELNSLGPGKQVTRFLHDYLPSRLKFIGSMAIVVARGNKAAVVGLVQNLSLMTVIPVIAGTAPAVPVP